MEERLHVGVVVHLTGTVHALHDAVAAQRRLVVEGAVLGEFNPSSQHVLIGGVDELEEVEVRSIAAREAPIAG